MPIRSGASILCVVVAVAAAVFMPAAEVRGQCEAAPLSIQVLTTGTFVNTCTLNPVSGRWDVNVTINGPVTSNSTVTIRGASTLMLGKVTIQNNSAIDCRVNILGSGFDQRIGGVGFIDKGTSAANRVLLLQLDTVGDVGYDRPGGGPTDPAIRTDMIANLSIGGNVLGALSSETFGRSLGSVFIQGDLRGNIYLAGSSSIDALWIGGNLGMPGEDPVRVYVSGNIRNLTAGAINADITTLANSAAGTVHSFETTAGNFKGSLTAHRLGYLADGAGPVQFRIAGDLDAGITTVRDMRAPFVVTGSFRQTRLVAGVPVSNIINAGTGLFDDVGAAPTSNMTIGGDFAGQMVMGTPLSAGLASVNRDINIGGVLSGMINAAQDIGANVNVGGGISGRIEAAGSLRSGRGIVLNSPLTGQMSFGASLLGAISLPPGGLQGQVVVNAGNTGGVWSGAVIVGGSMLFSPLPHYSTKSVAVGGGAVGVAPFVAHLDDCAPAHNSGGPEGLALLNAFDNPTNTPVRFRAYGPMQAPIGFTPKTSVAIEQLVGADWVDRSGYFNVGFVPAGASGRVLALSSSGQGRPPAGQYRLRNIALRSAGVAGSPSIVMPSPYLFRLDTDCDGDGQGDSNQIAGNPALDNDGDGVLDSCQTPNCPCDYNQSGAITVQDVFDFLAGYFVTSPLADINQSGSVTIQDIFDFLACYFNPPPGC